MRIFIYSYPSLYINKGGPAYKTEMIYHHFQKMGIDVELFDMWKNYRNWKEDDLFYIFTANASTWPLAVNLRSRGIRYAVNPIFFSNHSPGLIKLYRRMEKTWQKVFKRNRSDYELTEEICRHAEIILPNTQAELQILKESLGLQEKTFQVIPNGVEKRFADSNPDPFFKKFGLKDFVLYAGHLGPFRKNGLNIVKAMQKLDVPCVIIADVIKTSEGDQCLQAIEKSKNIHYIGWLEHDDPLLASAYAACHTFILPTRYETPGRAALEAALSGANIVITPKGGTKEYFADLAQYPDPLDVNSIVKETEKALNKNKTDDLKNRIFQKYTWETIAEETWNILKKL